MRTLNLGILAHVDAGKTSLTERLLYEAGVLDGPGSVDAGTTRTDTMALERQRGITIRSAVASFEVDGALVNLVDTPGHSDFVAEVERSLGVLDGAVLVVSGTEGVQAQSLVLFRALQRLRIPTLFFVNKLDRPTAGFDEVATEIRERLTPDAVCVDDPSAVAELLAGRDDEVLVAAVGDGPRLSAGELSRRLGVETVAGHAYPVLGGSAVTGQGVRRLMSLLPVLLPVPLPDNDSSDGEPRGLVFAIRRGDAREKLVHVRMTSGTLRVRDRVDLGHGRTEKVTAVRVSRPEGLVAADRLSVGEIGVLRGLDSARIGDVLGDVPGDALGDVLGDVPGGRPVAMSGSFVRPSLETVVAPADAHDQGRLFAALTELAEQDPLIALRTDDRRREIAVSLYGEVQKEVIEALLQSEYGVRVTFRESTPLCIERLVGSGADHELIATPSNPFLATVGLRVAPAPVGSGVSVGLEVELGSMPPAFFTAVEDSVRATLREGPHGWDIPDCTVTITHSGYWARQSSGHADFTKAFSSTAADFRALAPLVLMTALLEARTVVCEPVHRFVLEIPASALPAVLSALPGVGAVPLETVQRRDYLVVSGDVPAVSVHALQRVVPDLTRGEGVLTTQLDRYEPGTGPPPTRSRTDDDPTARERYLTVTARRVGRLQPVHRV